ncbi:hypothetical protein ACFQ5X_43780, partial [Streptomyces kaempferi]
DPRHHPRPAELLDRHLHHLPPPPAQNIPHHPKPKSQNNLTESYYRLATTRARAEESAKTS